MNLHTRLIELINPALAAPNGDTSLSALDFASRGEVAHEIADRIEAALTEVGTWRDLSEWDLSGDLPESGLLLHLAPRTTEPAPAAIIATRRF